MFIDGRQLSADTTLESDVCIIGGGVAGIALAAEFVDSPLRVLLLEGGGLSEDPIAGAVYGVVGSRPATLSVDQSKASFFGGNTNYWFGNCRPLDEADFESREWIPYSGWPFGRQELLPYYERAQSFLGLADFRLYDLGAYREQLEQPLLSVDESVLEYKVVQQCPELRFGAAYRSRLEASRSVQVLLHTRVVRLETNPGGDCVSAVEVVLPDGTPLRVEAGRFILATGGVENARLLLCSNQASPRGLGNDHDLVGRFFMEHWVWRIGLGGWGDGLGPLVYETPQDAGGVNIWFQLGLAEELMRTERVPGLMLFLACDGSEYAERRWNEEHRKRSCSAAGNQRDSRTYGSCSAIPARRSGMREGNWPVDEGLRARGTQCRFRSSRYPIRRTGFGCPIDTIASVIHTRSSPSGLPTKSGGVTPRF